MSEETPGAANDAPIDRRARRRLETIEEIVDIAENLLAEEGVNGLALSEVARRLGVKPPSIYKYFDSLLDIYDALFARGQQANLGRILEAVEGREPGLDTLEAILESSCRWCLEHPAMAQLMFSRPVPAFEPSPEAMAPSIEMVDIQRRALADAVAAGELGPGADSDDALYFVAIFVNGLVGMSTANEPGTPWGGGRFSPQFPKIFRTLEALYPPVATGN